MNKTPKPTEDVTYEKPRIPMAVLWIILACGAISALVWFGISKLASSSIFFATGTPTAPATFSSTSMPTATTTRTPRPTPTLTPIPAWVTDFAEPILSAIANQTPKIDDDFSDNTGGWHCPPWREIAKLDFVDEELVFGNACVATRSNMAYTDFVLEVDERLIKRSSSSWLRIDFRDLEENIESSLAYQFQINHDGSFSLNWPPTQRTIEITSGMAPSESRDNHIVIIAKGSRFAFFVNGQPVYHLTDTAISQRGRIKFTAYAMIALDNLRIWDISNLP